MENRILCICVWCLQESDGQGKTVSRATRTRHIARQKKTWPNPIDVPVVQPFNLIQNPSSAEATVVLSPSIPPTPEYEQETALSKSPPPPLCNGTILFDNEEDKTDILEDEDEDENEEDEDDEDEDENVDEDEDEDEDGEDEDSVEEEEHLIERVENEDERVDDNDDDQISMFEEGAYDLLILHF